MKKAFIIIGAMFLLLTSCSTPFVKPVHNDSAVAVAKDGTEFKVVRTEYNFPDQEIEIFVSIGEALIFECFTIDGNLNDYDYSNDIVENYAKIIKEYQNEQIRAYQFNWGIIYTTDNGETFAGVPKHEYKIEGEKNNTFAMILDAIALQKSDISFVEELGFTSETISIKKIYDIYNSIDCLSN